MNDALLTSPSRLIEPAPRDRVTALAGLMPRRPIVLVLGMHRSGTSLCSHILSALGVDMADDIGAHPSNARGHWERWEIVGLHDRILGCFNRDYAGRFHDFALPVAWWADPRVVQIRREIVAFLERRMGDGYFGFKDPRTVRLMPMWHQIFNELNLSPKVVLCLRNPAQVARSLQARDGLDPDIGEYRWLVHVVDFFRYVNSFDFCTVEYESWFEDHSANLNKLKQFLDLKWQQSDADLGLMLSEIIEPSARHDDPEHREAKQPLVRSLHKLACRSAYDHASRDQIGQIISQFVAFQQLQRPFLRAFEEVTTAVAKYTEVDQELTVLRAAAGERDAIVEAAERRATTVEARLADAMTEIEGQRAQLTAIARERDVRIEIEEELIRLRTTLAEREAALDELSRNVNDLTASLQSAQAENAIQAAALQHAEEAAQERATAAQTAQAEAVTLRDALMQAEWAAQERSMAAEVALARAEALRNRLAYAERATQEHAAALEVAEAQAEALREALAQAEWTNQQHISAAYAMQADVATLHETLAQAEQANREQAAAADAIDAEVAILRDALTRAEQAGREFAGAAAAMEAEIVELRDRLAHAQREAEERTNAQAAMQGEIVTLRDSLAQAQREAAERTNAQAAMQGEIVALRNSLAQAQREADERTNAQAAMQGDIVTLRDRLDWLQSEATERATAAAAMHAESEALREALEASRQVGKAAMAALQISGEAPPQPVPQAGSWRQAVGRIFNAMKKHRSGRGALVLQSNRG